MSAITLPLLSCRKFLDLLAEFYQDAPGQPALEVALIAADALPQPQQRLLAHDRDMTSTLEQHHGQRLTLRVLDRKLARDWFCRHIVLETAGARRPVEYGAIRIALPLLPERARREVFDCQTPLGGILRAQRLAYRSCPGAFFTIRSNAIIDRAFGLDRPQWLYGRCNCLADPEGRTIAEVIEILPPERE